MGFLPASWQEGICPYHSFKLLSDELRRLLKVLLGFYLSMAGSMWLFTI
jgi:hypothetical protein